MAQFLSDEIDFGAYMRQTEASAKVRKASVFTDEMLERFAPEEDRPRHAFMGSTKLRDKLEFRPGEVTVWAGYNGHRKSFFTGQVALDLCAAGERVLIASFEMSPGDTLARMAKQAFGLRRPAQPSLEHFAAWTDDRLWIFDHMGRIDPDKCMAVVRYFAQELNGTQILIDSMMMVCKSEEHLDEQKQFVTDVVRAAQEYGVHIHLVAHCRKPTDEKIPPTKYDIKGSGAISDQVQNVVMVWANKAKKAALDRDPNAAERYDPDARISVEKQRNGSWEGALKLWWSDTSGRFMDLQDQPQQPYRLSMDVTP